MLEKYKNNESHFAIRTVVFLCIIGIFILFNLLTVDPDQRSCLGPPGLLAFALIGFPLITILLVFDILLLAFFKALNWEKVLINLGLFVSMLVYFFLVFA